MKRMLFTILFSTSIINLHASNDNEQTLIARILNHVLADKGLLAHISSLQETMAEVQNHQIEHVYTRRATEYTFGGTQHRTTNYYNGDGDIFGVLGRYEEALDNLDNYNLQLAASDGAFLGVCLSILGNIFKWDAKEAGIGLFVSSVLLTIVKNKHVDKVPYLTMPELTPNDNYFGILTNIRTFLFVLGASSATYFGIDLLKGVISDKIGTIKEAVNAVS